MAIFERGVNKMSREFEISLREALDFVERESPASSADDLLQMAHKLRRIVKEYNEPIERAWLIDAYWNEENYQITSNKKIMEKKL